MKNLRLLLVAAVAMLTAISCNKDVAEPNGVQADKHTCTMRLVGSLVEYDDANTRAGASETVWADGSVIYLRMNSPMGVTTGEAIYDADTDVWTISYYGSLYEGVDNSCTAFYVEDKVSYENHLFTVDERTVIYEDLDGSYIFEGGDLIVTANLKPRTGRMRFTGDAGKVLKVYGLTHYATYDLTTDIYTTTTEPFKVTVGEDGYTPYIYGYFTNTDEPNVKVWIDAKEAYTRFCSKDIFNAGQSGVFTIPTEDSHNGWADGLHFNINGAQFKMIAVEGGTFTMGDPDSTSEYYTPHKVTLTGYCIGETELTEKLYHRVTNNSSSSTSNKPYKYNSTGSGRSTFDSFLKKLNNNEFVNFNLLTEAQWEFAAKGGLKSNGYKYSGSDDINDVAWYASNSASSFHDVKLKMPNELGIYDMSGNIDELVLDVYAPYPNLNQIDPIYSDSSKSYYVTRGGACGDSEGACRTYYRDDISNSSNSNTYYSPGTRLALNWND